MRLCLDSWAVLRWLEGSEPAATRVSEALTHRPVMSWINLGEVFYVVMREAGESAAEEVLATLRGWVQADEAIPERVLAAARLKAVYPMALADAFALATAQAHEAVLLTGDPEILRADGPWQVESLR